MPGGKHNQRGFTLIELIVVIILIGIISATAVSRFSGVNSISAPVYRDQLISSLRLSQMRAMQTRDICHRWLLGSRQARQVDIGQAICNTNTFPTGDAFGQDQTAVAVEDNLSVRFSLSLDETPVPLPSAFDFDSFGRISQCDEGCQITVNGSEELAICIEEEGYIHAC